MYIEDLSETSSRNVLHFLTPHRRGIPSVRSPVTDRPREPLQTRSAGERWPFMIVYETPKLIVLSRCPGRYAE